MWEYNKTDELCHYGVLGMRWGHRRSRGFSRSRSAKRRTEDAKSSPDSKKVASIRKKKVNEMSNQDLRDVNNRLQLERQYKDLTTKKNIGQKAIKAFIATGTTIAAIETSARTYKKVADFAMDKIGKKAVK